MTNSTQQAAAPALAALQPIDSVTITTLVDNSVDVFLPNQGPALRVGLGSPAPARPPTRFMLEGASNGSLRAEHGFSALLTFERDGATHRVLFDMGTTPDGMVENMRRLELAPKDAEAIVFSHGHFDH